MHYSISRKEAKKQIDTFNKMYSEAPKEVRQAYWKSPSSMSLYEYCFHCGAGYKEVNAEPKVEGVFTAQPIIRFDE